ncbi:MAG TPA: HipA domain-containing protein [Ramlibacter sp.]|nr:HipA domain-containing protein [Ramlibacter sp.]
MTRRAPVYRWTLDGEGKKTPQLVGELAQLETRWEFSYDKHYLALDEAAWELDPAVIRLKQRGAFTRVGTMPFPVFCDVALSGWSLVTLQKHRAALLGRETGDDEPWGWWERLLYAPADGFGALFVGKIEDKPKAERVLAEALASMTDESLKETLADSSSGAMGGERPKIAAFTKQQAGQVPVLLKFALPNERADNVVAEASALTLAAELGMRVPAHRVVRIGQVGALQIDRFDRDVAGHAFHCVSAATALNLAPNTDPDEPKRNYVTLRSILREPNDGRELFKRIVLNAAVGNNDDHPWNTSLRQIGLRAWELSPLYDVQPFFARQGTPTFRTAILKNGARTGTHENLIAAGKQIAGFKTNEESARVINEVFEHVRTRWRPVFEEHAKDVGAKGEDWVSVFEPGAA